MAKEKTLPKERLFSLKGSLYYLFICSSLHRKVIGIAAF